jgi:poly-beta-1,6-N-acetyl-D-glucosamine synthase
MIPVTILIPAHNEEENIGAILNALLLQHQNSFVIQEILVASDGSSDSTDREVRNIGSTKIRLLSHKTRMGKSYRLNELLGMVRTDIAILIDADVLPANPFMIDELCSPLQDPTVGIVCGNTIPLYTKGVIPAVCRFGKKFWDTFKSMRGEKGIRYQCDGKLIGLSKKYFTQLVIPNTSSDDYFMFYRAQELGFKGVFVQKAGVIYKTPTTLSDYVHQYVRYELNPHKNRFAPALTSWYEDGTFPTKLRAFSREWIRSPFVGTMYIFFRTLPILYSMMTTDTPLWREVKSSKNLQSQ